jgi:hypothetical protein
MPVYTDQSFYQFIGNATRSTNTTIATLPVGSVAIVNEENVVRTADLSTVSTLPVRVVKKKADGTLLFSPFFTLADIISKEWQTYVQPTEQVTLLGVNSASTVTGLGTVTVGNTYIVNVVLNHSVNDTNNSPMIKTMAYQAVTGDTQASIAKGLFESGQRCLSRNLPYPMINIQRIADGTGGTSVAAFDTATIAKLTKGSKIVSVYTKTVDVTSALTASTSSVAASTALTAISIPSSTGRSFTFSAVASVSHEFYIGEYFLSVASSSSNTTTQATALAAALNANTSMAAIMVATSSSAVVTITYKEGFTSLPPMILSDSAGTPTTVAVTIATGNSKAVKYRTEAATTAAATFTLDEPWEGETAYAYTSTTEATHIGVATFTTAAVWGLKFAGIAQPFDATTGKYQKVRFTIEPQAQMNQNFNPYANALYTYGLGFDSTVTALDVQAATEGSGSPQQIAEVEALSQWQNKNVVLQVYPPTSYVKETDYSKQYAVTSLVIKKQLLGSPGIQPITTMTINIAIDRLLTTNDNTVLQTIFTIS